MKLKSIKVRMVDELRKSCFSNQMKYQGGISARKLMTWDMVVVLEGLTFF